MQTEGTYDHRRVREKVRMKFVFEAEVPARTVREAKSLAIQWFHATLGPTCHLKELEVVDGGEGNE